MSREASFFPQGLPSGQNCLIHIFTFPTAFAIGTRRSSGELRYIASADSTPKSQSLGVSVLYAVAAGNSGFALCVSSVPGFGRRFTRKMCKTVTK